MTALLELDGVTRYFGALIAVYGMAVAYETVNLLKRLGANPTREADVDFQMVDVNLVLRQMQSGGSAALKFGKTKARVLLESTPRVRAKLARGDSTFARYLDHARRGAELARDDGATERVVRLIARHHERPVTEDERLLARADREALP